MKYKPTKEGFLFYYLNSYRGFLYNFILFLLKEGLEVYNNGLIVNLYTRATRARQRGTTGATAKEVYLPALKAEVYALCKRVTTDYGERLFICFIDNTFMDSHLAKALLGINIGICGTVRANTPGLPWQLKAIAAEKNTTLVDNGIVYRIVDNLIVFIVWRDNLRNYSVIFASTAFYPTAYK